MDLGRYLILFGIALVAIGCLLNFAPWAITWFGHLPGDIRIEKEHTYVFIPITSMLVVSGVLSLVLRFFFRQ